MKSICCIGHITHDRVITPDFQKDMPGGTAYYFAKTLRSFDSSGFSLVTAIAPDALGVVEDLRSEGIDVTALPSKNTVFFENRYGENMNNRKQRVLSKADPFSSEILNHIQADIYHLGTLLADDFSTDFIKQLSTKGIVSVDAQGFMREVVGEDVRAIDWKDKEEAFPYIDILKTNEHEMEKLTGADNPREAALILADNGIKEVVLTFGDHGSMIYRDGIFYEIPAYPIEKAIDATGCGDTYMAAYLYKRACGEDIPTAGNFAARLCSLKLAHKGPLPLIDLKELNIS